MEIKKKMAIATIGVLGLAGVGVGTALGQSGDAKSPTQPPAVAATVQAQAPAPEAPEPPGPDTDMVQEGDQTTPDAPGAENGTETPENGEKAGVEEPGDENLPGGGHADPPGNVDHQFEGRE